ncbi:MAG: hypothetical protein COA47_03100 [Robiginitomaculum sp.]|nr:MAG: hypothetical protein COA47_03100 [Robiginitomaculum sp.]
MKTGHFLMIAIICSASSSAHSAELLAQPEYQEGQTFIFNNGRVEQYSGTDGNLIIWKHRSGRKYSRAPSFFVPILQWKTSRSRGSRKLNGHPDKLWPLRANKKVRFSVVTNSEFRKKNQNWEQARRRRSVQFWTCHTRPMVTIQVPAGQFETQPVECQKFSTSSMKVLQKQVWYYSPAVGHYIRKDNQSYLSGKHSSILLVTTLTGRAANPKRIRSILDKIKSEPTG